MVVLHETEHKLKSKKHKGVILKIDFEKAYDSVKWGFVEEVLRRKGFGDQIVTWIINTICGCKVSITINGEEGPYFKTHRGLRQGDPLSPLLFNLVGDALAYMLNKAKQKGHIKGLVPHLVERGLTQLQYDDDTILLMNYDHKSIMNFKFLRYCFEWMTGLKINFHKSEVFSVGLSEKESARVANMLNCKIGFFPYGVFGGTSL